MPQGCSGYAASWAGIRGGVGADEYRLHREDVVRVELVEMMVDETDRRWNE